MYINKVFLTIIFCTIGASYAGDGTLMRNTRTINLSSSFLAWQPQVFKNFWPGRLSLWEWTKSGAMSLVHLTSLASSSARSMRIEFRPEDGLRAAKIYQRCFGYRGEWLIEQLGNGLGPDARPYGQPVPNTFLTPPLSPFKSDSNLSKF